MKIIYDKVFVTNLPSFYKISLYNEISKKRKIFVIFTGDGMDSRNADFCKGTMHFAHIHYKYRNLFYRLLLSLYLSFSLNYKELVIGGWDSLPMWIFSFFSPKRKNSVVVESSAFESKICGLKGLIKRIFIERIRNKAYVSGDTQKDLVLSLHFKGHIIKTAGVGIFNYIKQPLFLPRKNVRNFLYVGRLVEVKNLEFLIRVFNSLPELTLNIIGFGYLENHLKSIAKSNINFLGAVDNKKMVDYYQKNDVFILPSKSEPWGLVVEEALNNGLPVLISNRVGCGPEIVNDSNGLVFQYDSEDDLVEKIKRISDLEFYNQLRMNISKLDFSEIEKRQINCYL